MSPHSPLFAAVPQLYTRFFPDVFKVSIPREALANCEACPMTCQSPDASRPFKPDKKCCTFFPSLPNFLVGGILKTMPESDEGRRRIREAISKRQGVSPIGIFPPRVYLALYNRGRELAFGRSDYLVCPYYHKADGLCTIWRFREAVCSTYFCNTV